MEELARLLPSLHAELVRIGKTGKNIEIEGREELNKIKADVSEWLNTAYGQEKRSVVRADITILQYNSENNLYRRLSCHPTVPGYRRRSALSSHCRLV